MRIRYNLLAGVASSAWAAVLGIAVVPIYLKFLGVEAYGLVGFLVTLQMLFVLLDLGLAPAINREVARGIANDDRRPARELLHTLSLIYWGTGVGIVLVLTLAAPWIASHWLQSNQLAPGTVSNCIVLMGVVVGCRWPAGLYLGALMGAERMVLSSGVSVVMSTAGRLGAAAILAWVSRRIEVFFLWQAVVGIANTLTLREAAWRALGRESRIRFSQQALQRIWRFSAGLSGVTLCSVLLAQVDKLALSRLVSLSDFGRYSLATLIASSLTLLIAPVFNVIYPRLTCFDAFLAPKSS